MLWVRSRPVPRYVVFGKVSPSSPCVGDGTVLLPIKVGSKYIVSRAAVEFIQGTFSSRTVDTNIDRILENTIVVHIMPFYTHICSSPGIMNKPCEIRMLG